MARVIQEDEAVEALRGSVRRTFKQIEGGSPDEKVRQTQDLAEDLAEQACALKIAMTCERRWQTLGTALTALSVGLTATGPLGVLAGGLASAASLTTYLASSRNRRLQPAFAWLLAQREAPRAQGRENDEQSGFYHLTFDDPPLSSEFV